MSITDQQFESILLRLEGGESIASVQADFPDLEEDIAALQDLQDFFAAQRLQAKPDPDGLHSVLRQVTALNEANEDDEPTWGSFFSGFARSLTLVLPAFLVLGVSGYVWQSQLEKPLMREEVVLESEPAALMAMDASGGEGAMMLASRSRVMRETKVESVMDMKALAQSLSAEFASDMAEFENTKEELEPLFSEQLFSYQPTSTL